MKNTKALAKVLLTVAVAAALHTLLLNSALAAKGVSFLTSASRRRLVAIHTKKKAATRATGLTYSVTATAYQAVAGQTDDKPFITADNSRIKPHYSSRTRWLAISQDLLKQWGGKFEYGDKVRVQGVSAQLDGVYTVHDTMNKRYRHRIDILTHRSEKIAVLSKNVKLKLASAPQPKTTRAVAKRSAHKPMLVATRHPKKPKALAQRHAKSAPLASAKAGNTKKTGRPQKRLAGQPKRANYLVSAIL